MRRLRARDDEEPVEPEPLDGFDREHDVPVVNRVEAAAEDPDDVWAIDSS